MEPKATPIATARPARKKPAESRGETESAVRYFLASRNSEGGPPLLGKEVSSENEALIESLKTGVGFYALIEYRAVPDLTGKAPTIRKDPVRRTVVSAK